MSRKTAIHRRKAVKVYEYTLMDLMLSSPTDPMPLAFRQHQMACVNQCLHSILKGGQPELSDWRVCCDAINVTETLVRSMRLAQDPGGLLDDAMRAMADAHRRQITHGKIRLDGPGTQAVRAIIEDYAAMIDVLPERTIMSAYRQTAKRVHDILNSKPQPHDVNLTSREVRQQSA